MNASDYRAVCHTMAWEEELAGVLRGVGELLRFIGLNPRDAPYALGDGDGFAIRVPRSFARRMAADWYDPLLLQVLPQIEEKQRVDGFDSDTLDEKEAVVCPGVLHKYPDRVLVLACGACAMHCRFCFRRSNALVPFPADAAALSVLERYIERRPVVGEVLLSGGDPLMLDATRLEVLFTGICRMKQIQRIRIHTRMAVAVPSRIDDNFLALIRRVSKKYPVVIVLHVNHPREIDRDVEIVCDRLRGSGALLFNQSVLLKGINDSVEILEDLSRALLRAGISPYYLHQLDRVRGAHHFEVDERRGKALMRALRAKIAGYGVPRYVREIAGRQSKIAL